MSLAIYLVHLSVWNALKTHEDLVAASPYPQHVIILLATIASLILARALTAMAEIIDKFLKVKSLK